MPAADETPLSGTPLPGEEDQPAAEESQLAQQPDAGIYQARNPEVDPAQVPVLSVEAFLAGAKSVRKTAFLIMDGTLEDELEILIRQFDDSTDAEGNPIGEDGEVSLADKPAHEDLVAKINAKHAEILASAVKVVFEAMPGDDYEVLHARYRMSNGNIPLDKLPRFANELIAKSAVEPAMTIDQVVALRHKTSKGQFRVLEDAAHEANNRQSNIVPK